MNTLTAEPGIKGAVGTPKTKPANTTIVRRINGFRRWFVPNEELTRSMKQFEGGIMRNVTLNPKAEVMKDVFCGTDNFSQAEAIGELETGVDKMPGDAVRTCKVAYDSETREFYNSENREQVITTADYLLLQENGSSLVGWK